LRIRYTPAITTHPPARVRTRFFDSLNLKFRAVMRRGWEKVLMEVALLFMLHNILKLGVAEAYS